MNTEPIPMEIWSRSDHQKLKVKGKWGGDRKGLCQNP